MLTPKICGLFDVRDYDGKTRDHNARRMKADTDNIVFSAMFEKGSLPECFKINGKPDAMLKERASRKERMAAEAEGREPNLDSYVATFKIGVNAKWFDKNARQCPRPTNIELEESRWNVQIDFNRKEKDAANPLKPSGFWVNAIMIAKVESNPFEGQAFEEMQDEPAQDEPATTAAPAATDRQPSKGGDDLPF